MGRRFLNLNDDEIVKLYLEQDLTCQEIAEKFGCTDVTIRNHLISKGIKLWHAGRRKFKYQKFPFMGSPSEKMYLCGFRIGDLNVYKPPHKHLSRILVARCHTTKLDQIELIKELFSKYGRVTVFRSKINSFTINCFVDDSFNFLLNKLPLPTELTDDPELGWPFLAGYIDAEGNFIINQDRGRFKIDSYDYEVLLWVQHFLTQQGILNKFRRIAQKGDLRPDGRRWNKDLWRLNINEAHSLKKFLAKIISLMRHRKRIKDARKVLENINRRIINGTV